MITTIYGDMDESKLLKQEGVHEDERERTSWVEYYQLVHRSAHVTLKQGLGIEAILGSVQ